MYRYEFSPEQKHYLEKLKVPFAIYQFVNKHIVTLILSEGFCELLGYEDRDQAYYEMDHDMYIDTHPDDIARIANAAYRFAIDNEPYNVIYRSRVRGSEDYRIIHAQGTHFRTEDGIYLSQVWYTDEGIYSQEGDPSRLSASLSNALREESILRANYYDSLTGLPSMSHFFELAEVTRKSIEATGVNAALLFMDLSGMKHFNSKMGYSAGDDLLRSFSKLLTHTFHLENCCHTGADHFIVITQERNLEKILKRFFRDWHDRACGEPLPVRVGIYPFRMEDVPVSVAGDRAKYACDALREVYSSGFRYFSKELKDSAEQRHYILSNIDRAIEEKWIQVYYQPIVRATTGKVSDEEALARWIDPVKGFMAPAEFIPYLEDAKLLYKLDLYVLDQVLAKIHIMEEAGLPIVPQSVNLSRSDFDSCDIVEEIRSRVDASGVGRDKITIEITESTVGSDFDFISQEIARFQYLGFPVWMDDFGSGYSSLDVLQSVKFDLIKFDMSFMKKLDEGDSGKIVLTELMKMTTSLGVDTVCEGVETESHVRFLQEIGCSKLQGYYYTRPISLATLLERYQNGTQIGFENPDESGYYETIGKVNLYNLDVIAMEEESSFHNIFNMLPMGIMEIKGSDVRLVRSNGSYRDFIRHYFNLDLSDPDSSLDAPVVLGSSFMAAAKQCCLTNSRSFFDDTMADGTIVHSFIKKISTNPVTGRDAVALAVLSISNPGEGTSYADIARALAADYYRLYYVDVETEHFIEYALSEDEDHLAIEKHGVSFFKTARDHARKNIHADDYDAFVSSFTKEKLLRELDTHGVCTLSYRPVEHHFFETATMKIMYMPSDRRHLIIGISVGEPRNRKGADIPPSTAAPSSLPSE